MPATRTSRVQIVPNLAAPCSVAFTVSVKTVSVTAWTVGQVHNATNANVILDALNMESALTALVGARTGGWENTALSVCGPPFALSYL